MRKHLDRFPVLKRILHDIKKKLINFTIILVISIISEIIFATNNEIFASVTLTFIIEILYLNLYSTPNKLRQKQHIISEIEKLNKEQKRSNSAYVFNDNLFDMVSNYQDSVVRLIFYSSINMPLIICSSIEKVWQPLAEDAAFRILFCLLGTIAMCLICTGYATNFESKYINQLLIYRKSHVDMKIHDILDDDDVFVGEYSPKELEILETFKRKK